MTPSCIFRDIGIYIFATIYILIFSAFGEITVAIASILLVIYATLVIIVVIQDFQAAKATLGKEAATLKGTNVKDSSEPEGYHPQHDVSQTQPAKPRIKNLARKLRYHLCVMSIATKMVLLAKFKYRQEEHEKTFSERNYLGKLVFVIDFPFDIIRKLTIPPCEIEHFNKTWLVLWPFPGLFLVTWTFFGTFSLVWIYVLVPVCIILMAIFFFTCPENGIPKYIAAIEIIGLTMSVIWTYLVSSVLIDLLQMWTIFSGISPTYMGLTIIAVGSALPDAVTTLALSAKGYGDMAITGNYSSQCFGLLIGFGLAMLKKTITQGTQYFNLWDLETLNSNTLDVTAILSMLVVLLVSFSYGLLRNYHFDKLLGGVLIGIYAVFFVVATYFAIALILSGSTE